MVQTCRDGLSGDLRVDVAEAYLWSDPYPKALVASAYPQLPDNRFELLRDLDDTVGSFPLELRRAMTEHSFKRVIDAVKEARRAKRKLTDPEGAPEE